MREKKNDENDSDLREEFEKAGKRTENMKNGDVSFSRPKGQKQAIRWGFVSDVIAFFGKADKKGEVKSAHRTAILKKIKGKVAARINVEIPNISPANNK